MQQKLKATKEVTFDCAHMLSGHDGLCANLHGHTYKLQVTVVGTPIDKGSSEGMLIDFKDLKTAIQECVMDKFDHALIGSCSKKRLPSEEALVKWATDHHMRVHILPDRTTAENMAQYIKDKMRRYLYEKMQYYNIDNIIIKLWETPTSFVEV